MGRRPVENKKSPADYPQMAFRITSDGKRQLTSDIEKVQKRLNKKRRDGDPYINKNDIIIRAIIEGLKHLD